MSELLKVSLLPEELDHLIQTSLSQWCCRKMGYEGVRALVISVLTLALLRGTGVRGQSTVRITTTPPAERGHLGNLEEGDRVVLRCVARDLPTGYSVHWQHGTEDLDSISSGRVSLESAILPSRGDASLNQALTLTISQVVGQDRGLYRCEIRHLQHVIVSDEVTLTVFSFPHEPSPVCSPSEPVTVYSGDVTTLNCSTSKGYPAVNVSISSSGTVSPDEEWSTEDTEDTITRMSTFKASPAHDGVSFNCTISSRRYPNKRRTCTVGPIHVEQRYQSTVPPLRTDSPSPSIPLSTTSPRGPELRTSTEPPRDPHFSQFYTLFAGGSLIVILLVLSVLLNFALCCRRPRRSTRVQDIHSNCCKCCVENGRTSSFTQETLGGNQLTTYPSFTRRPVMTDVWI